MAPDEFYPLHESGIGLAEGLGRHVPRLEVVPRDGLRLRAHEQAQLLLLLPQLLRQLLPPHGVNLKVRQKLGGPRHGLDQLHLLPLVPAVGAGKPVPIQGAGVLVLADGLERALVMVPPLAVPARHPHHPLVLVLVLLGGPRHLAPLAHQAESLMVRSGCRRWTLRRRRPRRLAALPLRRCLPGPALARRACGHPELRWLGMKQGQEVLCVSVLMGCGWGCVRQCSRTSALLCCVVCQELMLQLHSQRARARG
mmetsp:Transcript_12867/g.36069  ORF Transcript_12867/g.36069 Transcript_12867/m.36069 type:complete len:253 (+) Transcript_12867:3080-3838(+)